MVRDPGGLAGRPLFLLTGREDIVSSSQSGSSVSDFTTVEGLKEGPAMGSSDLIGVMKVAVVAWLWVKAPEVMVAEARKFESRMFGVMSSESLMTH